MERSHVQFRATRDNARYHFRYANPRSLSHPLQEELRTSIEADQEIWDRCSSERVQAPIIQPQYDHYRATQYMYS